MKSIIKYLPIIYSLLIFIGYFNYLTFYRCFDIEISTYLTTGELLLSFLPLAFTILIIIAILFIFMITTIVLNIDNQENDSYTDNNFLNLFLFKDAFFLIINKIKSGNYKKWNILWILYDFIILALGALQIIFFILYIYLIFVMLLRKAGDPLPSYITSTAMELLSIPWIILFDKILDKLSKNNSRNFIQIKTVFIGFLFLSLLWISNIEKANMILNGKPTYNIKLYTNKNDSIVSDKDLLYIGKTNNFLFLRKNKNNIIYKIENINRIEINKIDLTNN